MFLVQDYLWSVYHPSPFSYSIQKNHNASTKSHHHKLHIPKVQTNAHLFSFFCATPKAWNLLPENVATANNFKKSLLEHRLQPSRNLLDSPENLGFIPGPRAYLTVQCTCPGRGKTSCFILVIIIVNFTSVYKEGPLPKLLNSTMMSSIFRCGNQTWGQFMGVVNGFRV